jgi:hypothetical protein
MLFFLLTMLVVVVIVHGIDPIDQVKWRWFDLDGQHASSDAQERASL